MSEANPELEAVLRRVQKLLAIAGDDRANPAEAAAAASMAEKVMRKYQLDHADVIAKELRGKTADLLEGYVFANMKRDDPARPPLKTTPAWGQILAASIARLHDCDVRHGFAENKHGKIEAALAFLGYGPDVKLCAWTFDYIVGELIKGVNHLQHQRKTARLYTDEGYHKTVLSADKRAAYDFRQGFVTIVAIRINRLHIEKMEEARRSAHSGRALVLASTKLAAIKETYGEPAPRREEDTTPKDNTDVASWHAGASAGRSVDVRRNGIEGNATAPEEAKPSEIARWFLGR